MATLVIIANVARAMARARLGFATGVGSLWSLVTRVCALHAPAVTQASSAKFLLVMAKVDSRFAMVKAFPELVKQRVFALPAPKVTAEIIVKMGRVLEKMLLLFAIVWALWPSVVRNVCALTAPKAAVATGARSTPALARLSCPSATCEDVLR